MDPLENADDDPYIFSPYLPVLPAPSNLGGLGGLGGINFRDNEINFRRKLLSFARNNGSVIDDGGSWYFLALRQAAQRHVDALKRKPGRPPKQNANLSSLGELLGVSIAGAGISDKALRAEKYISDIDHINSVRAPGSKEVKDAALARLLALGNDRYLQFLENRDSSDFRDTDINAIRHWTKLLSAARQRIGRPKQKHSKIMR